MKRKICALILTVILILPISSGFFVGADFNSETEIVNDLDSYAYYMLSLDDGSVLFSKNHDKKLAPAAFNKLVAAVVAIEEWNDLDDSIKITDESLRVFPSGYGIRNASLKAGETYTKKQLVDCLIIYSANDVASVIVYNICENKEAYLQKMNLLLEKIGCKNTCIKDILGFDAEGQYTTAEDVAKILQYALKYPAFSVAFGEVSVTMPATAMNNERIYHGGNKMMNAVIPDYYHSAVNAGKYTSTAEAGECIAVTTSKDGYSYLVIVMKGEIKNIDDDSAPENTCMTDAKKMIQWVYKNIFFKEIATPGQIVYSTDIQAGKGTDTIGLTPEKEISVLAPSKVSSYSVLIEPIAETMPKKIKAPVKKGDVICQARVLYANEELATINLVASEDISLSFAGLVISTISIILMSKLFIAAEIIAIILLAAYLLIKLVNSSGQNKKKLKVVSGTEKNVNNTQKKNTKQ